MAKLNFNFYGYDYEHGIMLLSDTLLGATDAMKVKREEADKRWTEYERAVDAGEIERDEERDEETGAVIFDQGMIYEHEISLVDEGVTALRQAYVIALYHHWERVIRKWTDAPENARHAEMIALVEAKGVKPPERFTHVYHLANVLKHNSDRSGPKLLDGWPEIFWNADKLKEGAKAGKRITWSTGVSISDGRMDEIFATMRASGPRAN